MTRYEAHATIVPGDCELSIDGRLIQLVTVTLTDAGPVTMPDGTDIQRPDVTSGQSDVDALLRLIDARINAPDTPEEERTRLQRLREAAGDVGQSVLTGLLGAWLSQVAGLGGG